MKSESLAYDDYCGQFVKPPFDPDNNPKCEDLLLDEFVDNFTDEIKADPEVVKFLYAEMAGVISGPRKAEALRHMGAKIVNAMRTTARRAPRVWEQMK